jgi:hypothetical protein
MAQVKKALVENGVVTNVALFDADNLPDWASAWVDATDDASVGGSYDGVTFVPPAAPAPTAEEVRESRDQLLAESDWTQVADAPVVQLEWATYRQALRDIPQQAGFPENVTWPEEPNG